MTGIPAVSVEENPPLIPVVELLQNPTDAAGVGLVFHAFLCFDRKVLFGARRRPVARVFNAEVFRMEHGFLAGVLLVFVIFEYLERGVVQPQNREDIHPRHETDPDIRGKPHQIRRLDGAHAHREDEDKAQHVKEPRFFERAVDVLHIDFGHVGVAQDRRERKEKERAGHKGRSEIGHDGVNRLLGINRTRFNARKVADERDAVGIDDVVAARRENHDARRRADEPRIDVDGKRLYEPLFGGV